MDRISVENLEGLSRVRMGHKLKPEVHRYNGVAYVFVPGLPDYSSLTLIIRQQKQDLQTCLASVTRCGDPLQTQTAYFENGTLTVKEDRIIVGDGKRYLIAGPNVLPAFYHSKK